MIKVWYSTIDRFTVMRRFKTLKGAQAFAQKWVGEHPEIGSHYAISGDGVGKITVDGATLADLFPEPPAPTVDSDPCHCEVSQVYGGDCRHTLAGEEAAERAAYEADLKYRPVRVNGCTCSDDQLNLVGCDCGVEDDRGPRINPINLIRNPRLPR
jgi:hypothetical protein